MWPRARQDGSATRIAAITIASLLLPQLSFASTLADETSASPPKLGIPLDNARFQIDGKTVLRGVFGGDLRIDAVSLGEATFTREAGKLHEIVAVRVWVAQDDGSMRLLSDEELASGAAPCRIVAGRDMQPWPTTALDTMGGLSVATMLINDGTADVRIDVLFPAGLKDDKEGSRDREPEAILVGPPPSGVVRLGAIIAGDIDDPLIAEGSVDVLPAALEAGLSGAAMLYGQSARAQPIAMVGYDLDDLGVHEGPAFGLRLEIPKRTLMACKIFACGESEIDVLASADSSDPLLGAVGGGMTGGSVGYQGYATTGSLPFPASSDLGSEPSNRPALLANATTTAAAAAATTAAATAAATASPPTPPVPAPGAVSLLLLGMFHRRRRLRRR